MNIHLRHGDGAACGGADGGRLTGHAPSVTCPRCIHTEYMAIVELSMHEAPRRRRWHEHLANERTHRPARHAADVLLGSGNH